MCFKFFIKIAPNLCRHMNAIAKGTKRPHESNIVSPPRRGPQDHYSMHSSPAKSPDFDPSFESFKARPRVAPGAESSKRQLFVENREEVNGEASSPGNRSGSRSVSFLGTDDADDSPIYSSYRQRPHFESPRSEIMYVNHVSPNSLPEYSPSASLKSNRGGARAAARALDLDGRINFSIKPSRSNFPVSNRGRGMRNVSSRGRSQVASTRMQDNEDPPMILKNVEKGDDVHFPRKEEESEKSAA